MLPIFIFVIGCFFGSFLNLLIDRLPRNEDVLFSRSHCDSCGKTLRFLDLIPVISFLFIKGECRHCHSPLSFFYPFMEVLTGLIFLFNYLWVLDHTISFGLGFFILLIYYIFISSCLIVIFFTDLRSGIIPNKILIFLLIIAIIYQVLFGLNSLPNHIISALISVSLFIILTLLTKGRGMGFGDTKFSFVLGFILGFPNFILGLYVAFLTGAAVAIILILWGKKRLHHDTIAFGPFLALGTFVALFFGEIIIPKFLPFLIP